MINRFDSFPKSFGQIVKGHSKQVILMVLRSWLGALWLAGTIRSENPTQNVRRNNRRNCHVNIGEGARSVWDTVPSRVYTVVYKLQHVCCMA